MKICPNCGAESPDISKFCIKCGSEFEFNIGFDKYINQETVDVLESVNLSEEEYDDIINDIIVSAKIKYGALREDSSITEEDLFPLDKILLITKSFASISFKNEGSDYGHYGFNLIQIDERLNSSLQIFTILKQLAHHLLAEILENVMAYVLDVEKDDELESVIAASFKFEAPNLMDEYCACIVQERFIEEWIFRTGFPIIAHIFIYKKHSPDSFTLGFAVSVLQCVDRKCQISLFGVSICQFEIALLIRLIFSDRFLIH